MGNLIFLHAQTSLHPGSGTALGVVDLPVQRERHTQWPVIPASSLKGVLRDQCRRKVGGAHEAADNDPRLTAVFGPPTKEADKHAGALSLTDARVLAFPVRSLRGVFAWVTCPAALERARRDAMLAGTDGPPETPALGDHEAAVPTGSPLVVDGRSLVLEEFEFTIKAEAKAVAEWVARHVTANQPGHEWTHDRIARHLVVIGDNDFTFFVRHATEVVARIALEHETKTVKNGALFFEEFIPAETIFYAVALATESRSTGQRMSDKEVLDFLRTHTPDTLQIGGNESTGKGICFVRTTTGA